MNKKQIPGLILSTALAGVAYAWSLTPYSIGFVTQALILGIVAGNLPKMGSLWNEGINFAEKQILAVAIALLGFKMSMGIFSELSIFLIVFIPAVMMISIFLGMKLSSRFGLSKKMGALLGMGNAVCGTSAIMATSACIESEPEETGISVGVINLLGTLALFGMPTVLISTGFSEGGAGIVTGGSLQAVGHAVAAGAVVGPDAEVISTAVKMARVSLLAPMLLWVMSRFKKSAEGHPKQKLPWFVFAFLGAVVIVNIWTLPVEIGTYLFDIQKILLAVAMVAVGFKIKIKALVQQGSSALWLGTLIFGFQVLAFILFVYLV
ncbi:MAG: YeiH family putative sulfate export transporter [Schleiferiaceae bacterium]